MSQPQKAAVGTVKEVSSAGNADTTAPKRVTTSAVSKQKGNVVVKLGKIHNELEPTGAKAPEGQELSIKEKWRLPNRQVILKPVPKKRWHKLGDKNSFKANVSIEALYDDSVGGYATGLTREEQLYLEAITGYKLHNRFSMEVDHPFFGTATARLKLENRSTVLRLNIATDYIKYKIAIASALVANSLLDIENGLYPEAEFYIHNEQQVAEKEAVKVNMKTKAYVKLGSMTQSQQAELVQILGNKTVRGLSLEMITTEVGAIIENNPASFLKYAEMDSTEVGVRAKILECINKNILTRENSAVLYMREQIASNFEESVQFFKDPQNQKMKIAIFEQLEN